MRDLSGRAAALEHILRQKLGAEAQLAEARSGSLSYVDVSDELETVAREAIRQHSELFRRELLEAIDFPPRHQRHFAPLKRFWETAEYEDSVFVMTKFPDSDEEEKDEQLEAVIDAVSDGITAVGLTPRVARGPLRYHPGLWDNVELHLLACARGVAIVEDRYRSELNPNLAMEWGWMRAMGKPVLYLVEQDFKHFRADTDGLIKEEFSWTQPQATVTRAVTDWLTAETSDLRDL